MNLEVLAILVSMSKYGLEREQATKVHIYCKYILTLAPCSYSIEVLGIKMNANK